MGKKAKIGKRRKDKFYHLAKETGYRSRSAFKLIQLNRKYQFLDQCRVLVDLCAAPGGWLQVAARFTPVSSVIVGVDLVPIKPIPNVISFQGDITTTACKQQLQKELKTWKADCVLNDGAPNVGSAWIQDAYSQAELTLYALKIACEFLRKGGWFITKIFRSKDYQMLMWVLQQLFRKVNATKPQASRAESAEIFVVCQDYLAPDKIDPKLLDSKHVFQDVSATPGKEKSKKSLAKINLPPKSAEGYADNVGLLYKSTPVIDFVTSDDHINLLGESGQLEFDGESLVFAKHPATTDEIRGYCEDVKVLGPGELRSLIKWRDKLREFWDSIEMEDEEEGEGEGEGEQRGESDGKDGSDLEAIDAQIQELAKEEAAEVKRERRRLRKQKKKVRERLVKKAETHREAAEILSQERVFNLKAIKNRDQLEAVGKGEMAAPGDPLAESEDDESAGGSDGDNGDGDGDSDSVVSDEEMMTSEGEGGEEEEEEEEESEDEGKVVSKNAGNPLVLDLTDETEKARRSKRTDLWFSNPTMRKLLPTAAANAGSSKGEAAEEEEEEEDESEELRHMIAGFKSKGGVVYSSAGGAKGEEEEGKEGREKGGAEEEEDSDSDSDGNGEEGGCPRKVRFADSVSDSSGVSDEEEETVSSNKKSMKNRSLPLASSTKKINDPEKDGFEIVPEASSQSISSSAAAGKRKLTPEELALGSLLVRSKKCREDLLESAYNRWTSHDEDLPDWFMEEERKYCQKLLPITKEMVQEYHSKLREINARPIKKVAEAKARKKRRMVKKMERARKKATAITEGVRADDDVSSHEKAQQLKQLYKKAGLLGRKKKEVEYVVAKRGMGKRVRRPGGVKGQFKVVDPRMKKDNRSKNNAVSHRKKRR